MRIVKIVIALAMLYGIFHVLNTVVAADTSTASVSVVPNSPIAASCQFIAGKTVVRIGAVEDISDVHLLFPDGRDLSILPSLQAGWSVAQTVTGQFKSVTVSYVWRGAAHRVAVPCE
jgi:hypothetical protein